MKKIIAIVFFLSFITNHSFAGECDTTISSTTTNQLECADDDNLNVTSAGSISYNDHQAVDLEDESGVQITNNGTIETASETSKNKAINAVSSLNTTITNNKTINADNNSTIFLDYAENVTITNNSEATISAEGDRAIEGRNIGWCDKAGNNNDCQTSLSSSGSTEVGLILHNHGTISSDKETIWLGSGSAGAPRSRGVKIFNYDGGIIKSTSDKDPIRALYLENSEVINYEGGLIQSAGRYAINTEKGKDLTITNHGTIESTQNSIYCKTCTGVTFENTGTITSANNTVIINRNNSTFVSEDRTDNTITNSGTITADSNAALTISSSDGTTVTNTGTITGAGRGIMAAEVDNSLTTNHGTISATTANGYGIWYENDGNARVNNILNNFGTISAVAGTTSDGIGLGKSEQAMFNTTINNSGTISGSDNSILVLNSSSTGIDIVTKDDGTYEGEIDLNSSVTTMTLDCSISKDQKIEIHGKTNMVITNNLCGNDTYEILDNNSDSDSDNSETDGYLYVYGEDLDIDSHNKKYRTEIFTSKLNNIFDATQETKDKSTYYSIQKRNDIYKNDEKGILGFFEKKNEINFLEEPFINYSDQRASFNNNEYLGSKNLSFGLRKQIKTKNFNASIVPILGFSQNQIIDVETETNQRIKKGFSSQFAGLNTSLSKKIDCDNESNLTIEVNGMYGIHKLPKYLSNFTDGDLSVDDAVDQVFGAGFNVKYSKQNTKGFILEPYLGLSANKTVNNDVEIIADGESKEAGHVMNGVLAKKIGFNLSKNTENLSFTLNFSHQDQDGLKQNRATFSLNKKFQLNSKLNKESIREIPKLERLFAQLQLAKENERLAELAGKSTQENKVMKELIIQLLKENQKLKTENLLFKNQ
jgi:hypothetical protein